MGVPEPTHCPDCRAQRRIAFRNERNLYPATCGLCKKSIVSIFSPDKPYTVYCYDCWYSDKWNPLQYGREFDFSRPFFEQFAELQKAVPHLYAFAVNNQNSIYTNGSQGNKDCYLLFVSDHNENTHYSYSVYDCKDVFDSINCKKCQMSYELSGCSDCYQCFYSIDCHNCNDVYFSVDLSGCSNCFGCWNLRKKEYCWFNEQLTREEYEKRLAEIDLGSHVKVQEFLDKRRDILPKVVYRYYHGINNQGSLGDYLQQTKNAKMCFESNNIEDCAYVTHGNHAKNCYDGYVVVDNCELAYEAIGSMTLYNVRSAIAFYGGSDASYCAFMKSCENVFGCVGLRQAKYCILNKQYTKEEYEALLPRIVQHMKQGGEWGEFFPVAISPFAYNETAAFEYYPVEKEEVLRRGWKWKDDIGGTVGKETLSAADMPENIRDASDDVVREVLACASCQRNFKITKQELDFYRLHTLPLPRKCFNCRHLDRLTMRNPRQLWQRSCMCAVAGHTEHAGAVCTRQFATSYGPERPETVWCEECYRREIA